MPTSLSYPYRQRRVVLRLSTTLAAVAAAAAVAPRAWAGALSLQVWVLRPRHAVHRGSRQHRCTALRAEEDEEEGGTSSGPLTSFITPIGPFCSFRSPTLEADLAQGFGDLSAPVPTFSQELAKINLDAQMGQMPDPVRVGQLAQEMEKSLNGWEIMMTKLALYSDFQSREYRKLTEMNLRRQGKTIQGMAAVMRYQIDGMKAFSKGLPPPFPPPGLDMTVPKDGAKPGIMSFVEINAQPFTTEEPIFQSAVVREEFEKLILDHRNLILLGAQYGSFDPLGKLAFLDQMDEIERRWDIFYGRLGLMGQLNPLFREQSEGFLASMGMTAAEFRGLLHEAHQAMREDAERERMS